MESSALSFCSTLPPTGISRSTSLSKVLQEKLAITLKTLEDSWGSVHTGHSLRQTEVYMCFSGSGSAASPHPGKMRCHCTCYSITIQLGCLLSGLRSLDLVGEMPPRVLWAGTMAPKELPVALAVPSNSGSWREAMHQLSENRCAHKLISPAG